jgi:hypothetical protein
MKFWSENLNGRDHAEELGGKIILRWIFEKLDVGVWTGLIWIKTERMVGFCELGKELSG